MFFFFIATLVFFLVFFFAVLSRDVGQLSGMDVPFDVGLFRGGKGKRMDGWIRGWLDKKGGGGVF